MGFAWASKWTGIYASAGLAFLFFLTVYWRAREYFGAEDREKVRGFARKLAITLGCCVVFFVAVPLVIYYCSYYWQMLPTGGLTVQKVLDLQITMFNYHNDLEATHSFASPWYEWPLIVRPMWYYSGADFMPADMVSSISCMGNPAVWWTGLAALIVCLWRLAAERKVNQGMFIVAVGFASQYLPWVLISRCTFIYHYFASVPFLILAIVFVLERIRARDARAFKGASIFLWPRPRCCLPCSIRWNPACRWRAATRCCCAGSTGTISNARKDGIPVLHIVTSFGSPGATAFRCARR